MNPGDIQLLMECLERFTRAIEGHGKSIADGLTVLARAVEELSPSAQSEKFDKEVKRIMRENRMIREELDRIEANRKGGA